MSDCFYFLKLQLKTKLFLFYWSHSFVVQKKKKKKKEKRDKKKVHIREILAEAFLFNSSRQDLLLMWRLMRFNCE